MSRFSLEESVFLRVETTSQAVQLQGKNLTSVDFLVYLAVLKVFGSH